MLLSWIVVLGCGAQELQDITELTDLSLLNGWRPLLTPPPDLNQPPSFWKDEVFVHLQGCVYPNASFTDTIFILPDGFRPLLINRFVCATAPNDIDSRSISRRILLEVFPSGIVKLVDDGSGVPVTSVSMDGVRFTWAYTDDQGALVETGDGKFENITDVGDELLRLTAKSGYNPPAVYKDSLTGITYLRGTATLSRRDCADPSFSCDMFLLREAFVPSGFSTETAIFPQAASNGYVLVYPSSLKARARLYKGIQGDTVCLDGIVILPTSVELARNQPTTQSSIGSNGFPEYAVDGNTDSDFTHNSCIMTNTGTTDPPLATEIPWWRVDLGQIASVKFIRIAAQSDVSISGFELRIGNSLDDNGNLNPLCGGTNFLQSGESADFECGGMSGRYVNVRLTSIEYPLTLCEVQVFGTTAKAPSGQAMQIIIPKSDTLFGGWAQWTTDTVVRAHKIPTGEVCLAGRMTYLPDTESFNQQPIGTLNLSWRPRYRTKQPIACYIASVASTCVLSIDTYGVMMVTDGQAEPAPDSGVSNWIVLEGVCYGGSEYLARIELQGSSVIELKGNSHIGIG